jgi:hypothetical protein
MVSTSPYESLTHTSGPHLTRADVPSRLRNLRQVPASLYAEWSQPYECFALPISSQTHWVLWLPVGDGHMPIAMEAKTAVVSSENSTTVPWKRRSPTQGMTAAVKGVQRESSMTVPTQHSASTTTRTDYSVVSGICQLQSEEPKQ